MSDKNFDSIKNFEVPQAWVDNALSVPQTTTRKKPIVFLHFSRYATMAASILLIFVLSVVVFMLRDDNIVPVDDPTVTQSTTVTDSKDSTSAKTKQQNSTTKTKENGVTAHSKESTTKSDTTEPTKKPTKKPQKGDNNKRDPKPTTQEKTENTQSADITDATIPTQNKTEMPTIEPTEKPIEKPTQKPTQRPTVKPTVRPTQRPTQKPTQKPTVKPTSKPPVEPTVSGGDYATEEVVTIYDSFLASKLADSGKVYCSIYSSSGKLLGDSNLYSSQHRASVDYKTSSVVQVSYDPLSKGLWLSAGRYSYSFYNENGVVVARGYINVY